MELSFTKNKKYIQQRPENENITKNKNKNLGIGNMIYFSCQSVKIWRIKWAFTLLLTYITKTSK